MDEIVSGSQSVPEEVCVLAAHVRSLASDTLIAQRDVGTHRRSPSPLPEDFNLG